MPHRYGGPTTFTPITIQTHIAHTLSHTYSLTHISTHIPPHIPPHQRLIGMVDLQPMVKLSPVPHQAPTMYVHHIAMHLVTKLL